MARLHPRFEAYGLTDADAELVASFRFAAQRAGWPSERLEQALDWYKTELARLPSMSIEARAESFQNFASARGWPIAEVQSAAAWCDATAAAIDAGQSPELPPMPTREQDAARRAELENMMREDPGAYWRNTALQDELYDINGRGAEGEQVTTPSAAPAAGAPAPQLNRRAEIETMMREDAGRYWSSPDIQAEYRGLLGGGADPGPVQTSSAAAAPAAAGPET